MLAEQITALRTKIDWSMSRLARELNVHADLIVDWESGARFPTKRHNDLLLALVDTATKKEEAP